MSDFSPIVRRKRRRGSQPVKSYQLEEPINFMQEHSFLFEFNDDDVIEFENNNLIKVGNFKTLIRKFFTEKTEDSLKDYLIQSGIKIPLRGNTMYNYQKFMGEGVTSKLLKLGHQNWKKGKLKLRLSLEFEPDEPEIKEPESPLDDIRQSINQ